MNIKDKTKSSKRHTSSCHPKLGGAQPKLGLTPKTKEISKYGGWIFMMLPRVVTGCGQTSAEMTYKQERHRVDGEEGDFERCFPLPKNHYTPMRQLAKLDNVTPSTSHKSPCSTTSARQLHISRHVQHDHCSSHKPAIRQLRRPSGCTNSISTTTDNDIL